MYDKKDEGVKTVESDNILIKTIFRQIENKVRKDENYIPRNYQTVGGMWTVDTYKKGDITIHLMDEGWTTKIFTDKISAIDSGGHFKVEKGTLEDFDLAYKSIN